MKDDREFFEDFVQEHTARALAFCRSRLGARSDAEDIVQDVMLRLFSRVDQIRELKDPLPYLYRALRNAMIDRVRAKRDSAQLDFDIAAEEPQQLELESEEATLPLLQALELLPEDQREMLRMRYFDELSVAQVAEIYEIAPAAAAMRLARARAKLKSELHKLGVRDA